MRSHIRRLNRLVLSMAFVAGVAIPSWAGPIPPACVVDTLENYLALPGGCTIGDLLFANFSYIVEVQIDANAVPAANVTVTPLTDHGGGLAFEGEWYSTFAGVLVTNLSYSVGNFSLQPTIGGAGLGFTGNATGGFPPTLPFASVFTSYCLGGPAGVCSGFPTTTLTVSTNSTSTAFTTFPPVGVLGVTNFIAVNGGSGQAEVDGFRNTVVPEPGLLILIGLGAGGLIARRRRTTRG
jgi:hypothetical protein